MPDQWEVQSEKPAPPPPAAGGGDWEVASEKPIAAQSLWGALQQTPRNALAMMSAFGEKAGEVADWAKNTEEQHHIDNLNAIAGGKQPPHSQAVDAFLRLIGSYSRLEQSSVDPKNVAISGAVAAANTNPITGIPVDAALMAHGGYGVYKNFNQAVAGNPEAVQNALMSAAEATGGASGIAGEFKTINPSGMYEKALKPSTTLSEAERAKLVQTGLENKIPVSKGGFEKLGDLIDDLNDKTAKIIAQAQNQGATVNKYAVASRLGGTAQRFETQVNPEADLNAVSESGQEFLRNQPNEIPAAKAQAMKQGTYAQLRSKYGELGSATVESQKALARGIKEELITQFPELEGLGQKEGAMLQLEPVLERAVNRISNHQTIGIGTPIAAGATEAVTGSGKLGAIAGLMKAIVDDPYVKSRLAIAMYRGGVSQPAALARLNLFSGALAGAVAANSQANADLPSGLGLGR